MSSPYPHVARPLTINGCELRNRIVRTAHATGFAGGFVNDRLIAYHEARARGGVSLSILEIASVHPTSLGSISGFLEQAMDGWAAIAERCHASGMKLFQQVWHGGAHAFTADGGPSWAPSPVPSVVDGRLPLEMSDVMIDEVVEGFAATARRCQEAGLDGVEVHGAHGYLLCQFLSPLTNRRTDDYGGSLENRMRLTVRVMQAIRAAVGPDYPIGIRLGTEATPGGLPAEEVRDVAAALERERLVDFLDISMGSYYGTAFSKFIGPMHEPHGYELPTSTVTTRVVGVPTIVAGRFTTLQHAEDAIARGDSDLVSMVRATMADPNIVAKSLKGNGSEVRPCISCNQQCVGGLFGPAREISCVVNVHVGREADPLPLPVVVPKRVLVIGAGPAGLMAARAAAKRGHLVSIYDAAPGPGGLVNVARTAPHRHDLGLVTDWLATEMGRLGVLVHWNRTMDAAAVLAANADTVVVATGSRPRVDGLQRAAPGIRVEGVDLPHVVGPVEVLRDGAGNGVRRALVFDDLGTYPAIGVTEHLLEAGVAVTLATSQPMLGAELGPSLQRDPAAQRLGGYPGFSFVPRVALTRTTPGTTELRNLDSGTLWQVAADLVVLVTGFKPEHALFDELRGLHPNVVLVGDALAPAYLGHAIATGHHAGTAI